MTGTCLHCGRVGTGYPRGLCKKHYEDKSIRVLYPSGNLHATGKRIPTCSTGHGEPTTAQPGSEEKLSVLIDRYSKAQELFHPDDYQDGA